MLFRLLQILAFGAVIAAFILSPGIKNQIQNPVLIPSEDNLKEDFNRFISENIATSSSKRAEPQFLVNAENLKSSKRASSVALPPVVPVATTTKEINYSVVQTSFFQEKNINLQSIVLVRCIFQTQYYGISSQPWNEEIFNVGTGVIVSPKGLILTARHVLEVSGELLNDPAGREWKRIKCDTALTDKGQTPIASISPFEEADGRFKETEIIFLPDDEDYNDAKSFDFALLKIKLSGEFLHINSELFPYLVNFAERDPAVLVGYPGRESSTPQRLERFDGEFLALTFYKGSLCVNSGEPCGLRYIFRRYPYNFEKDFWKNTDLGIVTPYFRGGFSGAPVFYRGNLIGIATHGISGGEAKDGWDQAVILTSWDILGFLKRRSSAPVL